MTDKSNLGPLESQVFDIFRDAWDKSLLKPPPPSDAKVVAAELVEMLGQVEAAIRLVAAAVDRSVQ